MIVYRKGDDLVKDPMKSRNVVPKNVPGVGHTEGGGRVGHAGVGGSYRGGVGWVIQEWMIHTEHYHHLHTLPPGNYLELLGEPNSITTTHLIT